MGTDTDSADLRAAYGEKARLLGNRLTGVDRLLAETRTLRSELRDATAVIEILLRKLGGTAEITDEELLATGFGDLIRIDGPDGGFKIAYREPTSGEAVDAP